jgi:hypothetical protein
MKAPSKLEMQMLMFRINAGLNNVAGSIAKLIVTQDWISINPEKSNKKISIYLFG